jgi:hypothetical protein
MTYFFYQNDGKKYDLKNIFLNKIFSFNSDDDDKWICSEIVSYALQRYLNIKFYRKPKSIYPAELYIELKKKGFSDEV